ncbi:hypothetical protein AUP68_07530 [Ilyonectria robusta]
MTNSPRLLMQCQSPGLLTDKIRAGRVRTPSFPDNICLVVEGQDYSAMPDREREYWNENFDGLTKPGLLAYMTSSKRRQAITCLSLASCSIPDRGLTLSATPLYERNALVNGTVCAPADMIGLSSPTFLGTLMNASGDPPERTAV